MFKINSLRNKSPEMTRCVTRPEKVADRDSPDVEAQSGKPKVAVFITHGMGQQIPFETLDSAVEGLTKAAKRRHEQKIEIRTCTVEINGNRRQRAEFDMLDAKGTLTEVHVYEGYWAPITEGHVTLRDTMKFLFAAGWKGLRDNTFTTFKRWVMGGYESYGTQGMANLKLVTTLGILLSLVALNLAIGAVSGDKLLHRNGSDPYFSNEVFNALTSVAGIYMLISLVFGALLVSLMVIKKRIERPHQHAVWRSATRVTEWLMWGWFASTIVSGALIAQIVIFQGCVIEWINDYPISTILSSCWLVIWATLMIMSLIVKQLLVQFMGDVAVYIDSHSLDRFSDMRHRIKAKVLEQATDVYTQAQYQRIAMVGHSLGSVVTYDTLNALINNDELDDRKHKVIDRTSLLLTFGSPLDKTAYVFASQSKNTSATREALAANLQPLIQSYDYCRDINWINVHSPRDIISGDLQFYDNPRAAGYSEKRKVQNIEDKDALIPLVAHIEYWTNTTLFDQLYDNI